MESRFRFRAWDGDEMWPVENICFIGAPTVTIQYNPVMKKRMDSVELMQCTGLKDKNGVLIYEKDCLGGILNLYVDWCDKCYSHQLFYPEYGCFACSGDMHWREIVGDENLEVIGNILENPNLLD